MFGWTDRHDISKMQHHLSIFRKVLSVVNQLNIWRIFLPKKCSSYGAEIDDAASPHSDPALSDNYVFAGWYCRSLIREQNRWCFWLISFWSYTHVRCPDYHWQGSVEDEVGGFASCLYCPWLSVWWGGCSQILIYKPKNAKNKINRALKHKQLVPSLRRSTNKNGHLPSVGALLEETKVEGSHAISSSWQRLL